MSTTTECSITVCATFTAEPIAPALSFWLDSLEISAGVVFAPFAQVYQQLLDPGSALSVNQSGLNVILFRTGDLGSVEEFASAVDLAAQRDRAPLLLVHCPQPQSTIDNQQHLQADQYFSDHWSNDNQVSFLPSGHVASLYQVAEVYSGQSESVAGIPYSDEFFSAAGSCIARQLHNQRTPACKVIVLDCDNTLWSGVCAEQGAAGISIEAGHIALFDALIRQQQAGVLLCLCSKNNPADVYQVFSTREDLALSVDTHIVAERINWQAKSQNLIELAAELDLGLDSFVFIDDNPLECAEVRAVLPQVLTVQAPADPSDYPRFLQHFWAFDRLSTTAEDARRTLLYKEESQRTVVRGESQGFEDFLQKLQLSVEIIPARETDLARIAQLTQRTNQFNTVPAAMTEQELRNHLAGGVVLHKVEVADRFGDYGLAGAIFTCDQSGSTSIEGWFLSCRVLGRGVEHSIVNQLALQQPLQIRYRESGRNEAARLFLETLDGTPATATEGATVIYHVPAGTALKPLPSAIPNSASSNRKGKTPTGMTLRVQTLARTPAELATGSQVLKACQVTKVPRPALAQAYTEPRDGLESQVARIWQDILGIDSVGALDTFSELGGSSLQMAQVNAQLATGCGIILSLAEQFSLATVRSLVDHCAAVDEGPRVASMATSRQARSTESTEQQSGDRADFDIAIVGTSLRLPGAANPEQFWNNISQGVESITTLTDEELLAAGVDLAQVHSDPNYVRAKGLLHDIEKFDAAYFGILPKEAQIMDPQHRLFLELCSEAIERAGYDSTRYAGKIGVFAGAYMDTYLIANICRDSAFLDAWIPAIQVGALGTELGNDKDYLATRVAYKLNLRGPSMTVQTACSTSLVAIAQACQSIIAGQADMALAGGVTITVPQAKGYSYTEGGILSPDGHCRAFDHRAAGTVFSNGGGVVLLKRLKSALADGDQVHAVIRGFGLNNDGADKQSYTAPSVAGQADVITMAQRMAGITPETISYVEAHGTGTSLGDPIEVAGLTQAFREGTDANGFCALGSVKPNVGHLDVASGVTAVNKICLAMQHRQLPPLINFDQPNPAIDFASTPFYVNTELTDWRPPGDAPLRAGVSSFGVGGTNAHLVIEQVDAAPALASVRDRFLLPLSAKTETALQTARENLSNWLQENPAQPLEDIAYTLQVGRQNHSHRCFVVAESHQQAIEKLGQGGLKTTHLKSSDPAIVFMFPGQGAQKVNMAHDLYRSEPVFREYIDTGAEILKPEIGCDIRSVIFPGADTDPDSATAKLKHTLYAQPAIFLIETALAKLWLSWGIKPAAMLGHSVGEFAAACVAGVFDFTQGLHILAARGRLMGDLPGGGMLSVRCPESRAMQFTSDRVELAAVNGAELCVLAGPDELLLQVQTDLAAAGIVAKPLHTSHAFHSWMMEPVIEPFAQVIAKADLQAPAIPILSTVTGEFLSPEQAADPYYWAGHLRKPVLFHAALDYFWQRPEHVLMEVGPGNTLATVARQNPDRQSKQTVLSTSAHAASGDSDAAAVMSAVGGLWAAGVELDWSAFYRHEQRRRTLLPTYPFERKRHWFEPAKPSVNSGTAVQTPAPPIVSPVIPPELPGQVPDQVAQYYAPAQMPLQATAQNNIEQEAVMETTPSRTHAIQLRVKEELSDLSGFAIEDIDAQASFLELGFDSLLLTQVSKALEQVFAVKVTIRDLLDTYPSTSAMADHLDATIDPALFAEAPVAASSAADVTPAAPLTMDAPQVAPELAAAPQQPAMQAGYSAVQPPPVASPYPGAQTPQSMQPPVQPPWPSAPYPGYQAQPQPHPWAYPYGMPAMPQPDNGVQIAALAQQVQQLTAQVVAITQLAAPGPTLTAQQPAAGPALLPAMPRAGTPGCQTAAITSPAGNAANSSATEPAATSPAATAPAHNPPVPMLDTQSGQHDQLTGQQAKHVADLISRYVEKTGASKSLTQQYRHCYADPRTAAGFNRLWKEMCYPIVVERSKGSRLTDRDGNEYIDLLNGFGPGFLGHSPEFVTQALHEQVDTGFEVGPQSPIAGEVAALFCELTGNERASFVNTGSEAVQAAMRLARTVTGRDKIALFDKDYHGNFDEVLVRRVGKGDGARTLPSAPGIPRRAVDDIIVLPYGTDESLEIIKKHAHELAAVLVEPIQSRRPEFQPIEFLRALREVTEQSGTVLVFDEVITGFRTGPGGAQAWFGIQADIATYGKVAGGGMPIGVVAGKACYMDTFDGGTWQYDDDSFPDKPVTFFAGTFVRHPLAMAATRATLEYLAGSDMSLWSNLRARADRLASTIDAFFVEYNFPFRMPNFGSQMFVRVTNDDKYANLLFYHLRQRGVFLLESFPSYLTLAHSDGEIDFIIDAFKASAFEMQANGFFPESKPMPRQGELGQAPLVMPNPLPCARNLEAKHSIPPLKTETAHSVGNRAVPLTDSQKEIFIASSLGPEESCAFNEPALFEFDGVLDLAALSTSLNELVARHDALRARFSQYGDFFRVDECSSMPMMLEDLRDKPENERAGLVQTAMQQEASTAFDFADAPLIRARLLQLGDSKSTLLLTAHHLVCDGWSFNVLAEELGALYTEKTAGNGSSLEPAPVFSEYAWSRYRAQLSVDRLESRNYWLQQYSTTVAPSSIPVDKADPDRTRFDASTESTRFEEQLLSGLRKAGAAQGATLYATLVAAFQVLLHRLSGDETLVLGILTAGQTESGWENLVGDCVGLVPLRSQLLPATAFSDFLKHSRSGLMQGLEHRDFGYQAIRNELNASGCAPEAEFLFNMERMDEPAAFGNLRVSYKEGMRCYSAHAIYCNLIESPAGCEVNWTYNSERFKPETIRYWMNCFTDLLNAIVSNPNITLAGDAMAPGAEGAPVDRTVLIL